jgi:VCBS repeat protein
MPNFRFLLSAALSILLGGVGTPAFAQLGDAPKYFSPFEQPGRKVIESAVPPSRLDRASVIELYHTLFLPTESVLSGWNGNVASCNAGSTTAAYKQAVIDRANYYRALASLPWSLPLLGGQQTTDNQNAALMMSANNSLSHTPPTNWLCYTASGSNGAGHSNIALGLTGIDAVDAYIDDWGSNNTAAGHRRWILYPPQIGFGTGDLPNSNALWIAGNNWSFGTRPNTPNGVAWPPQGYVPWDLLPANSNRWSFSYPNANFSASTSAAISRGGVSYAATYEAVANGYGDNTFVFLPQGFPYLRPDSDTSYAVNVSGVSGTGIPPAFSYTVTAIDAEQLPGGFAGDFNGDGKSDLLWHNAKTGDAVIWLMNGLAYMSGGGLMHNTAWRPTHIGDFNADGKGDVLWRSSAGETALMLINGTQITSSATLLSDPNWRVTHVADFNGDGKADLLWRNDATGLTLMWTMNGTQFLDGGGLLSDPNWLVTHVADFNGDGKADLVWRNTATGGTALWLMNGTQYAAGLGLMSNPDWQVDRTADLNGDGKADLIWRNAATGVTAAWLMNGVTMLASSTLHTDPNWRVVQTGDFDGDGKSDLVWRNRSNGQTAVWIMNGLAYTAAGGLLSSIDWQPAKVANFNGDTSASGKPKQDLLWRNSRTGDHVIWIMSGAAAASGAAVLNGTTWWAAP